MTDVAGEQPASPGNEADEFEPSEDANRVVDADIDLDEDDEFEDEADLEDDDDELDEDDDDDDDELDEEDDAGNRVDGGRARVVLDYITKSIASEPDAVVIEADDRGRTMRFRIHVAPGDMGRMIGRRGRVAQAIRTLVRVAGSRDGVDTNVDFVDD